LHVNLGGGMAGGKCDILIFRCNSDIIKRTTSLFKSLADITRFAADIVMLLIQFCL